MQAVILFPQISEKKENRQFSEKWKHPISENKSRQVNRNGSSAVRF